MSLTKGIQMEGDNCLVADVSHGTLSPGAMALAVEAMGVKKAHEATARLLLLAILGGAFVALGGMFAMVTMAGGEGHLPYGVMRLLGGITFSLGLVLTMIGGAQLFTSDCLMVMSWASGRLAWRDMVRVWIIVWLGNLIGALGTAGVAYLSGFYRFGHGAVGATALYIASSKASLPGSEAFFLGVLCNVLVCLAVWLAVAASSVAGKILAICFPVSAFVAAGFEHCVADMFFVPLGMLIRQFAPGPFLADAGNGATELLDIPVAHAITNLLLVTAGNWVGGALLVGGIYWAIYRCPRGK
jgi:formate/nitrite transporter